jgi:hypothetical protein
MTNWRVWSHHSQLCTILDKQTFVNLRGGKVRLRFVTGSRLSYYPCCVTVLVYTRFSRHNTTQAVHQQFLASHDSQNNLLSDTDFMCVRQFVVLNKLVVCQVRVDCIVMMVFEVVPPSSTQPRNLRYTTYFHAYLP